MRRREFIALLSGAAAAWPLAARAQQPAMPVIGFLRSSTLADATNLTAAFRQGLQETGYVAGQNVATEYRFAENDRDKLATIVKDFIHWPVAVIVGNLVAALAAKAASTTVPIVFATGTDPVAGGSVCTTGKLWSARECHGGGSDKLRSQHYRCLSPSRCVRGANSQGREAGRSAGHTVHQIRVRDQPQDRQEARTYRAVDHANDCRRGDRMRRREFILLLSGAVAWPLTARAQQQAMPVVTLINARRADTGSAFAAEFRKGLSETGFAESDVRVEYHWLDGHYEELPSIINDAVRRAVAVIATPGSTPAALAAKAGTATIPIVFGVAEDPVALGLVASLAHPGGNATGINFFASEIDAKRLGLMHEVLPKANRLAVLVNPANHATAEATSNALKRAAPSLGLELVFFNASTAAEIDAAFTAIAAQRVDALFIAPDGFLATRGAQLVTLAARDHLPASIFSSDVVKAGLLMSYGTSLGDVFRQVGV